MRVIRPTAPTNPGRSDCLEVDLEVVMHRQVAKAGDSTPRYFRLGCLEAITEPLRRFRDGLQIAYYGVLHQP